MRIVFGAVLVATFLQAQPAPDAARVLADMRQALGGDAAIATVKTFSVAGTESHSIAGHTASSDVELLCALPDRFLHVRRRSDPLGRTTEEDGFNGNDRIHRRDSDMPYPPDPGENDPPAQKAQREARALVSAKRELARLAIAMIGVSSVDPVDLSYEGQRMIEGRNADVVVLHAADGYEARVFVDAATHLPLMVSWMGTPIVTATANSIVAVPRGQTPGRVAPSSFPAMPDPKSLPPVEHQLIFDDYKTADGFTWPHRLIERVGGHDYSTTKLGKFKLNPEINAKRFDPRIR